MQSPAFSQDSVSIDATHLCLTKKKKKLENWEFEQKNNKMKTIVWMPAGQILVTSRPDCACGPPGK